MAPTPSNTTVPWTDHGIPGLVCTPAHWSSLLLFYLANYAAHCATIKFYPAETHSELALAIVGALLFPSSGLARAVEAIRRRPRLRCRDQVQRGLESGAMCMVVRKAGWEPRTGEVIRNMRSNVRKLGVDFAPERKPEEHTANLSEAQNLLNSSEIPLVSQHDQSSSSPPVTENALPGSAHLTQNNSKPKNKSLPSNTGTLIEAVDSSDPEPKTKDLKLSYFVYSPPWMKEWVFSNQPVDPIKERKCKIHGSYQLPEGYEFAYVPTDAVLAPIGSASRFPRVSVQLSSSSSLAKTCLALFQTGYAAYSVYRAQGDQIAVYGYAAFGLTVIPYIVMSILNLVAQIMSDDYPMLYMVQTAEMDEAIGRGGTFLGAVAKLEPWAGGIDNDKDPRLINTKCGPWRVQKVGQKEIFLENQDSASPQCLRQIEIIKRGEQTDRIAYIPNCSKFRRKIQRREQQNNSPINSGDWRRFYFLYRRKAPDNLYLHTFVWPLSLSLISFALLGGLSQFQKGTKSTSVERGFTMSWLVAGMLFGFLIPILILGWQGTGEVVAENDLPDIRRVPAALWEVQRGNEGRKLRLCRFSSLLRHLSNIWQTIVAWTAWVLFKLGALLFGLGLFVFCVPAVGGFVVVGKMFYQYGSCSRV